MIGWRFRAVVRLGAWGLALWLAGLGGTVARAGEAPLPLLVFDRAPYYLLVNGRPAGGFLLDIGLAVFEQAGVAVEVREMPPGRILATFESRDIRACGVGWLRTPEREAHARFSLPLYVDSPLGVVVRPETARGLGDNPRLGALLDAGLTWGLRQGFSHGPPFDQALAKLSANHIRHFADTRAMLRLVALGRLDAVLIGPEELSTHLAAEPSLAAELRFLPISDAPPGLARHIMCGRGVPAELMVRLDAAIIAFRQASRYRHLTRFPTGR